MFCSNCGKQILETAKFCPNCGVRVVRDSMGSSQGATPSTRQDDVPSSNDGFSPSADMTGLQELARCAACLGRYPREFDEQGNPLTDEQAANLMWIRCSQCRCGTHDWYRSA